MTAAQGQVLRRFMTAAWCAFMAACALELLVFALVDPMELGGFSQHPPWSRQGVYTAAFFAFWVIALLSNCLALLLSGPVVEGSRAE